jgi:uncharacterized protein YjbI with pentapeptide repeats
VPAKNATDFNSAFDDLIETCESGTYESIDLRGFKFPDFDYHGKTFKKAVDLRRAEFSGNLNFEHVVFEGPVDFFKATFHGLVNFQCAVFNSKAQFIGANFKQKTLFVAGEFKEKVLFQGCKFFDRAVFQSRRFSGPAIFHLNTFYKGAAFMNCKFDQLVDFSKTLFKQRSSFDNATFSGEVKLEETNISLLKGMKGVNLNFRGAILESAYFWGCPVLENCSFNNAFLLSCNLSGKSLIDCDFTGAVFKAVYTDGWTLDDKTIENTKFVFTDYKIVENMTPYGNEREYIAVQESRVPIVGNFGDEKNKNYTIYNFAMEPYKWEYLLDLPEEIQTGVINYINFFHDSEL